MVQLQFLICFSEIEISKELVARDCVYGSAVTTATSFPYCTFSLNISTVLLHL